jgi:hypothetical protein
MSYIILRGWWCDIIVLNVYSPTEVNIDIMKDSFYEELECAIDKLPKYYMEFLGDYNAKAGRKDI